ncbi:2-dehydropantoate 2-reductase [Roseomonas sp. GC11]|uniref:ketopantoate reductase family protein n=1 Tax=Roseomonas sp. GC11 TaxID=2950546 RepID=UPI00210AC912|nr:2-dehydropantoate 2-reductase [Roseomonas sp. GC11]MCQ4158578.1 2-dehydropantoate 2-reductase [Roseomonas sp. GC11]
MALKEESAAAQGMAGPVLVWGAGAIGGTVGAALVRAGHAVVFCDIEAEHVAAIRDPARGLAIEGPIENHTIHAPAWTPETMKGRFRRVLLCVKAQHTAEAARALLPHLAEDGFVVSLQNGLCEPVIAEVVGAARTVGAFVNFSADWLAPGRVLYGGRGALVLGELDGRITPRLEALHRLLALFEPNAVTTGNIQGYLWGKLGYAAMLFAQGIGEKGIADALARPELLPLWRELGTEVMRVAAAEGVTPLGFNGFDPAAFAPGAAEAAAAASVAAMVAFNRPNAKTHSGIWRDLWVRRRRTEVDAQLLPVAEAGRRHAIPTPALDRLIAQVHACETGARPMADANLTELLLKELLAP